MKKFSITTRVTLWYTLFMLVIMLLVFLFIYLFSSSSLRIETQKKIKDTVLSSGDFIEYTNGTLNIQDKIEKNRNDVYLSVYDAYGNLLKGSVPRAFDIETPFSDHKMLQIALPQNQNFFYYDEQIDVSDYGIVWVRGITSYSETQKALDNIALICFITMPLMILFVLFGGYFVTKRALHPVEEIRQAAENISAGEDLNLRLGMQDGKDEIDRLATTFDLMFERLENAFKREKQFTSDISHELRTPISIISLESEKLLQSNTLKNPELAAVEKISSQSQKMSVLLAQMLLLARTEKGQIVPEFEAIPLNELVGILMEETADLAENKQIVFQRNIPETLEIQADKPMLIRILTNLINNAIAYGHEGGYVTIYTTEKELAVFLTIEDNGVGIAEEEIDNIWDRFYRIDTARNETAENSVGLGLSMVHWLIHLLGWKVTVESKLKEGSRFILEIPKESLL